MKNNSEQPTGDPGLPQPNSQEDDDFVPGPLDEEDAEAFEDRTADEEKAQDRDDADPLAPLKPPFVDVQ
jgi:hypothetical protein